MESAITPSDILRFLEAIVALAAGIAAIIAIVKYITGAHDQVKKWNEYDKKLTDMQTDYNDKISDIKKEQCMQTYVLMAILDGLKQLNCNGPVTEAQEKLNKFINKQAHDVDKKEK